MTMKSTYIYEKMSTSDQASSTSQRRNRWAESRYMEINAAVYNDVG